MDERRMREIKSVLYFAAGLCWLLFAGGFALILIQYLTDGAALQLFGYHQLSSITIGFGVRHVLGFAAAAFVCFAVGMLLCLHGLIPADVVEEGLEESSVES